MGSYLYLDRKSTRLNSSHLTASRTWYTRTDNYFIGLGFTKSEADAKLYHIVVDGKIFIIVLYVDDLILMGDEKLITSCKEDLAK